MNATLSNLLWLEGVSLADRNRLRTELTVNPRGFEGESPEPICLVQEAHGRLGLPIVAGLKFLQSKAGRGTLADVFRGVDNRSSNGHDITRFVKRFPAPRNPEQVVFFEELTRGASSRPAVFAEAPPIREDGGGP